MNEIILVSGFSRKIGKNKLLMDIGEEVILQKAIRKIKKGDISNIILITREDNVIKIGIREEIQVIENESAAYGQGQSIEVGLTKVNANQNFMSFYGNQSFIGSNSIDKSITASMRLRDNIIIPRVKDKTGSPVIFPKFLKDELETLKGDVGDRGVIRSNNSRVIYVDINNDLFLQDIDTMDDYKRFITNMEE